jgi:hypothetical protein
MLRLLATSVVDIQRHACLCFFGHCYYFTNSIHHIQVCVIIFQFVSRHILETRAVIFSTIHFLDFVRHLMYKSMENL